MLLTKSNHESFTNKLDRWTNIVENGEKTKAKELGKLQTEVNELLALARESEPALHRSKVLEIENRERRMMCRYHIFH